MSDALFTEESSEPVRGMPSRPRGRACIVLTHEYKDQKEWAAKLARQTDSVHLNLLELFARDAELSRNIVRFSVLLLFDFFKTVNKKPEYSPFRIHHFKADFLQLSAIRRGILPNPTSRSFSWITIPDSASTKNRKPIGSPRN